MTNGFAQKVFSVVSEANVYTKSEPGADRGPRAGSPRGVVDATGHRGNCEGDALSNA
jgi:hypothetical protein